ncbi:hypothetical protein FACS1894105_04220 [Clostridia bacterium]|nr:hypothetical protein FACS1894105_04220 [Clostridia bacterium]
MKQITMDIETFSSVDLGKSGVYKYSESLDFEILLFAYSIDGSEVEVLDLSDGRGLPPNITSAILDQKVEKHAYNASFERVCLSRYLLPKGQFLNPVSWRCDMVHAAYLGLPLSLESVGEVLGLERKKLSEGKNLIRLFCKPPRYEPENTLFGMDDKWERFKAYNKRDVETELEIQKRLSRFPVPDEEWENYKLDQEINDAGIKLDMVLVNNAIEFDERSRFELISAMQKLTGLDNPNSVSQMKTWLAENGLEIDSLGKKEVAEALKTASPLLAKILKLRQQSAKSSVKKYSAMREVVCLDERARGLIQFYGAGRTGRYCLAENTQVKVKHPNGEICDVAIQNVATDDLVWDGLNWVKHEGVVFRGDHDVIEWDGVVATENHIVYVSETQSMTLMEAKKKRVQLWRGNLQYIK